MLDSAIVVPRPPCFVWGVGLLVDDWDLRWRELIRQNRRTGDTVFGGWASQIGILIMISCSQKKNIHLHVVP